MSATAINLFNQIGLSLGFIGSLLLWCSSRVGVISKDGSIIFNGLDPMVPPEQNVKRVRRAHWRNRYFTPIGWCMLVSSFLLQLLATIG